jgi:hypothetical protein
LNLIIPTFIVQRIDFIDFTSYRRLLKQQKIYLRKSGLVFMILVERVMELN